MEHSTIEYIIKPQNQGRILLYKVLTVTGISAACAIAILILLNLLSFQFFMPAALVLLSVAVALCVILLRLLSVEYEISIGRIEISVVSIHGRSWRRPVLDLLISDINEIGIYDDDAYEKLRKRPVQRSLTCVSSLDAPDIYYAVFEIDGELGFFCFEADELAVSRLRSLNPRAFRQGSHQ